MDFLILCVKALGGSIVASVCIAIVGITIKKVINYKGDD